MTAARTRARARTRNIRVEMLRMTPVEKQRIEMVERKGLGHPDSLCDGIAEAISAALSREYKRKCGIVLHHNTDKTLIVAGSSAPRFGGGEVTSPMHVVVAGRAIKEYEGVDFATDTVALKATKDYLRRAVRNLDVESHVVVDCKLGRGSADLIEVCRLRDEVPYANDTSFGVAHAPLSETEKIVLNVERRAMQELRNEERAIGEDMKVMGVRDGDKIHLTVADAIVSKYVDDYDHYMEIKRRITEFVRDVAQEFTEREVSVAVNTGDTPQAVYITVTGTSAEMGDDGCAGRGNRCNGLITPNRPISMEAASGKNPINHTGKIYNLLANKIANEVVERVAGVEEVYIKILSQIGHRIDEPQVASAQIVPSSDSNFNAIENAVRKIIDENLAEVGKISEMVIEGKLSTF
ncbi:MAG: methionine adenosyltransferase [Candidatus Alkanophagales archaeon]